tara:strand:- start:3004 stop:3393 length:390 start_codon:yes stop_codon:yes gene_type:complete
MSGIRNYSIFVSCQINPSEDPSKIKTAIFNVFPDLKVSVNDQQLIGKSNHINSLSKISESIKSKKTAKTYERILKKNISTNSTWFYLNKQAAFVDTIAICDEADESSLGPIKVVLEANDIEITIKSITS